jgi:hypothetical protein
LPVALLPGVPFATPPASVAVPVSSTPMGVSFAPWIVTVSVVLALAFALSFTT